MAVCSCSSFKNESNYKYYRNKQARVFFSRVYFVKVVGSSLHCKCSVEEKKISQKRYSSEIKDTRVHLRDFRFFKFRRAFTRAFIELRTRRVPLPKLYYTAVLRNSQPTNSLKSTQCLPRKSYISSSSYMYMYIFFS